MTEAKATRFSAAGKITGVFGIKGWVKVVSFTEPEENLFEYQPWQLVEGGLRGDASGTVVEIERFQRHKEGWIALIKGVNDRTQAEKYKLTDILVDGTQFPALPVGEYYWRELIGLRVFTEYEGQTPINIGYVSELMETGANDVLVVRPDNDSVDDDERLIPYVPEQYVKSVDLIQKKIFVDWHLDD